MANEKELNRLHSRDYGLKFGLVLLVLVIAAAAGVFFGNRCADRWAQRRAATERLRRMDESVGLGPRTGLTGELELQVSSVKLAVYPGRPINIRLTLTNRTSKPMILNGWLTPAPVGLDSNQLPFKLVVSRAGQKVAFRGNAVLFPPHAKKDFFKLDPGQSREIPMELPRCPGIGGWDMSAPGDYSIEIWYETYLTGKYVGVDAWTGMTNHVVVQVTVYPQERIPR